MYTCSFIVHLNSHPFSHQGEFFYTRGVTFVNYGQTYAITGCNGCDSGEFMRQGACVGFLRQIHPTIN